MAEGYISKDKESLFEMATTDLNTLPDICQNRTGMINFYTWSSSNVPRGSDGFVITVRSADDYWFQYCFTSYNGEIYYRIFTNNVIGAWSKIN